MSDLIKTILKIIGIVALVAVLGALIFNEYQQNQKINELISKSANATEGVSQIQVESIISSYLNKNGYVAGESDKYVESKNLEKQVTDLIKAEIEKASKENKDVDMEAIEKYVKEYVDEQLKKDTENQKEEKKTESTEEKKTESVKKTTSTNNKKNTGSSKPTAPSTPTTTTPSAPTTPSTPPTQDNGNIVIDGGEIVVQ